MVLNDERSLTNCCGLVAHISKHWRGEQEDYETSVEHGLCLEKTIKKQCSINSIYFNLGSYDSQYQQGVTKKINLMKLYERSLWCR